MSDPKLSKIQEAYVKKMEREKFSRELLVTRMARRNRLFLFGGLGIVASIYFYTMHTIKQETFLDELDADIAKAREKAEQN